MALYQIYDDGIFPDDRRVISLLQHLQNHKNDEADNAPGIARLCI